MWREGLGAASIIVENKKGYRNHPATQEFIQAPQILLSRLSMLYLESKSRGYNFDVQKLEPLTEHASYYIHLEPIYKPWQTLEEQIKVLQSKGCACKV